MFKVKLECLGIISHHSGQLCRSVQHIGEIFVNFFGCHSENRPRHAQTGDNFAPVIVNRHSQAFGPYFTFLVIKRIPLFADDFQLFQQAFFGAEGIFGKTGKPCLLYTSRCV